MTPETVGHYRILAPLGQGTYGTVYTGVHLHDDHLRVAVKLVHPALAHDPEFLAALKAECRLLHRLRHPHIVGFRDLVLSDDHPPAMVLDLLEGGSLEDHLQRGPSDPAFVFDLLSGALSALEHAHAEGVVHRDIKPGNILLDARGRSLLVDFGIAKAADSGRATKTGAIVGTLEYMAPELFQNVPAGPATDLYALGLVAWELLAGRRACPEGHLGSVMGWHMMTGATPIRQLVDTCPVGLAAVVDALTQRDAAQRVGTAREALMRLRESGVEAALPSPGALGAAGPGPRERGGGATVPQRLPETVELRTGDVTPPVAPASPAPRTVSPSLPPSQTDPATSQPPSQAAAAVALSPAPPISLPAPVNRGASPVPGSPSHGGSRGLLLGAGLAVLLAAVMGGALMSGSGDPGGDRQPVRTPEQEAAAALGYQEPPDARVPDKAEAPTATGMSTPRKHSSASRTSTRSAPDERPAPVADRGTLSVSTTPPGATVYVDDERSGKAPLDLNVRRGDHAVRVELSGYKGDARTVLMESERLAVSFELRPEVANGKVAVFGVPNSKVSVDGIHQGTIPFQVVLSEGTHLFKVTLPSGETFTKSQELRFGPDGRAVTLNLSAP